MATEKSGSARSQSGTSSICSWAFFIPAVETILAPPLNLSGQSNSNPALSAAHYRLAQALSRMGQKKKCAKEMETFRKLHSARKVEDTVVAFLLTRQDKPKSRPGWIARAMLDNGDMGGDTSQRRCNGHCALRINVKMLLVPWGVMALSRLERSSRSHGRNRKDIALNLGEASLSTSTAPASLHPLQM